MERYNEVDTLKWYEDYKDHTIPIKDICKKYDVKSDTMIKHFRKMKLKLRTPGFKVNNCRGINGQFSINLQYKHQYKFAYKRRATRKNQSFNLSFEKFLQIVTSDCHYCGVSYLTESRTVGKHRINMLTVDRVDSTVGYEEDNCVPCCKMCNTMKMDYQFEAWITKMQAILKKLGRL